LPLWSSLQFSLPSSLSPRVLFTNDDWLSQAARLYNY
jgi:hypothetical protein